MSAGAYGGMVFSGSDMMKLATAPRIAATTLSRCACVLFLSVGTAASAQGTSEDEVLRLINAGQFEAARTLFETQNPSEAEYAFFEGRTLKVQGRLAEAIKAFRTALQIDPEYIQARRELAHTLLLDQQFDVAEYHFNALLDIDPNPQLREGYRDFLNVIDRNKPVGLSGYFSLIPSSNINRGTTNAIFDTTSGVYVIDPSSKANSGVGAQVGIAGYFRKQTGPKSRVSVNWNLSGTQYEETIYNYATGSLSLAYERSSTNTKWSISPYLRSTWREDDADSDVTGLSFSIARRLSDKNQLGFSVSHEYRHYPNQSYNNGNFEAAAISLIHQVDPSLSLNVGLGLEQGRPSSPHLQYHGNRIFAGVSKAWEGGLNTVVGIEAGARGFVGDFPLTTAPRKDTFHGISATIYNTRIEVKGFTPRLSCSFIANHSNVAFYDYSTTECQATVSKKF
ncbi:surface lipoprotein assembly modifier [Actibacterium lipolyticum]|uniref:Tetratricopeptide repeat protein n=1 Tax=Actibacterium lipolyticum TaxID=1524263 RepID=A0A238JPA1_9RHOB|nr:surface lipoprotein assembly modifier [Actibacterium lipolyticum]SMX32273.1 Tetratricopeptide repeat protein [Actibacterium lipolyticum]